MVLSMPSWSSLLKRRISVNNLLSLYIEKQSDWWSNIQGGPQITRTYLACNWTIIVLGGTSLSVLKFLQILTYLCIAFILLHSYYINRRKYHKIRLLAETCAVGAILSSVCNLICKHIQLIYKFRFKIILFGCRCHKP